MDAKLTGRLIAEKRKEKGLNQIQLAEILNVSNRTISKWENGDGFPDITLLPDIAKSLDITIDELLTGEKPVVEVEVKTDDDTEKKRLLNNYRICNVASAFLAVFGALLGLITEIYNISSFPHILFYNHWEIMFAAVALGTSIMSLGVFLTGAIRLHLAVSLHNIVNMSRKYVAVLAAILCIFPLSFFARVFIYITPSTYKTIICLITAASGILAGIIIYRVYKKIGAKYEKDN